jgi:hypothetical protein
MARELLFELIEFTGILTFILLILTILLGLARWKLNISWIKQKYHFILAVVTIIVAALHFILNLIK